MFSVNGACSSDQIHIIANQCFVYLQHFYQFPPAQFVANTSTWPLFKQKMHNAVKQSTKIKTQCIIIS